MPTVTVLAPDSALAMDEVIRQLGDNAYILGTRTRDGQVEILATTEPTAIQPPRNRVTSVSFADVISEQVAKAPAAGATVKSPSAPDAPVPEGQPDTAPARSATIVMMPQPRARSTEAEAPGEADGLAAPADAATVEIGPSEVPADAPQAEAEAEETGLASTAAQPAPADQAPKASAEPIDGVEAELRGLLRELSSNLARLETATAPRAHPLERDRDPIEAAGFSAEIARRLAPDQGDPDRAATFARAMAQRLVAPDPMMALRAPIVVIAGPSGAGKTVLAGKIAALTLETHTHRRVELVSLNETPPMGHHALPIYARMLSIPHRNLHPDQLDASQIATPETTHVFDTNLDHETLHQPLSALREQIGANEVAVILALPVGSSPARIRAELNKYKDFDPIIALTKLDECELSPQEASQIAEGGTQIAWLSGTRALTETMAPATQEMMSEFLTGLLAARF